MLTNERGMQIFKGNPHIAKLIEQKTDTVPNDQLSKHIQWVADKHKCTKIVDFSESIEVALSLHPRSPEYKLPKHEKLLRFNRNFYEYTFEHADERWEGVDLTPEIFFDQGELDKASGYLRKDKFNLLVGMSGSGTNKAWPWTETLCLELIKDIPNIHIITVGDEKCRLIEPEADHITNLSGKIPMRISMALTGLVDCVLSPDTGLLHGAGCYQTPKIGILGHNTREVITKHFANDYSIEADPEKAECAPCLFLVYNMKLQCPIHLETGAALCMGAGITTEDVRVRVMEVYEKHSK